MVRREIEAADIAKLYECFSALAIQDFNETKRMMPRMIAVTMGDKPGDIGQVAMVPPESVNLMQKDNASKAILMHLVQFILEKGAADCVVHVTEIWTTRPKKLQGQSMQDALRQHQDSGITPSEDPTRREALMIAIHTKERTYAGICPITGTGADRVAEFKPLMSGGELGGGMAMQARAGHVTQ